MGRVTRAVFTAVCALSLGALCLPLRAGDEFGAIDSRARSAPSSAERSVASLSAYLTETARSDGEKARAIFVWVTTNITYDLSCMGKKQTAATVLQTRRAVCAGYATLFHALAEAAGLESAIVYGEAKGLAPGAAQSADGLYYHDWNAVKIDGRWGLVDSAWGSGRIDSGGRFSRRFDDHFFLGAPEMFIYDHLPKEPKWQLLEDPLSRREFLGQVEVRPEFFDYGLRLADRSRGWINAEGAATVTIGAPRQVCLMATLLRNGRELDEGRVFAQRTDCGYEISARLPSAGDYRLRIFARERNSGDEQYESVVDYRIHSVVGNASTFPKLYLSFQQQNCVLDSPLSGDLRAGKPVTFRLSAPGAEEVLVLSGGRRCRLAPEGGGVFAATVEPEAGEAVVFARYPGERRHVGLLRYVVR